MTVRDEIHRQIVAGLKDAKFPINTPEELLAAFPAGADTTCKAEDFPFKNAKEVADTIVDRAGI